MVLLLSWDWITCVPREGLTRQAWDCSPLKDLFTRFALGWSLGTWISRKFPLFPNLKVWPTMPLLFMQTVWFMPKFCFRSGNLEFLYILSWGCLVTKSQERSCVVSLYLASLGRIITHAHTAVFLLLREQQALCDPLWERDSIRKSVQGILLCISPLLLVPHIYLLL